MESLKKRLERVKISIDSHIKDDINERKKIRGISSYRKNRMRAAKVKAVPSNPRRLKMNGRIKSTLSGLKKQMPAAEMQGMLSGSQKQEMPSEEFQGLPSDARKKMPSAEVQGLPSDREKKMPSAKVQGLPSDPGKVMPFARVDANCNIVFKENFKTLFIEREYFVNQDVKRCMEELNNVHKILLLVLVRFKQQLHKKCEELLRHEDTCDVRRAQKVEARNCAFQAIKMLEDASLVVYNGYMRIKVHTNKVVKMYDKSTVKDANVDVDLLIESLPASLPDRNERFFIEKALNITNCMVNQLNRHFKPIYENIQNLECLLNKYFYQTGVVLY